MECSSWSLDPGREWSSLVAGSWLYSSRWTVKDEKQETTIPPYIRTYAHTHYKILSCTCRTQAAAQQAGQKLGIAAVEVLGTRPI